jgi:hypothetical protein
MRTALLWLDERADNSTRQLRPIVFYRAPDQEELETNVIRTTFCVKCPYLLAFTNVVRTTFSKMSAPTLQKTAFCARVSPNLGQENPCFGTGGLHQKLAGINVISAARPRPSAFAMPSIAYIESMS